MTDKNTTRISAIKNSMPSQLGKNDNTIDFINGDTKNENVRNNNPKPNFRDALNIKRNKPTGIEINANSHGSHDPGIGNEERLTINKKLPNKSIQVRILLVLSK
jgi:hypothetical protein